MSSAPSPSTSSTSSLSSPTDNNQQGSFPGTAYQNDTGTRTADMALADKLAAYADQLAAAEGEIRRLSGINARLREKVTNTAASRTEADPLATSRVPETVITSSFRTLVYRIHVFVENYYKYESAKDLKAWAKIHRDVLSAIHPHFINLAVDKAPSAWLVEAVIWKVLMDLVFSRFGPEEGEGMLWAGSYSTKVYKLSHLLSYSTEPNDPERQRAFHHWRALTTTLITTGGSQQTDCRDAGMQVTEMLENILESFSSPLKRNAFIKELETITDEAVQLDQTICKQQTSYRLKYPAQMFNGEAESTKVVSVPAAGWLNAPPKKKAAGRRSYLFVVTPILDRSGGRRGEGYGSSEYLVLEPAQVYVGSHS